MSGRAWMVTTMVCVAASAMTTGRLSGQQSQTATFRAGTDAVTVDVSVRDGRTATTGLNARDFEVFDNGVRQEVSDVSFGKVPIDVTVALDVSFSVSGPLLDQLRRAVLQLMHDLGDGDRLKLMTFNTRVSRVVDFTTDASAVERAIRAASAGGGSSIWDTVGVALVSASHPDRRQLVVLFTDGADSSSTTSEEAVLDLARRTNASLTAVVPDRLTEFGVMRTVRARLAALERLGTETGGSVLPAGADLTGTFRRALEQFRSSYVLHFTPRGVERAGFHTLEVRIAGAPKLTVVARRGYFAD